MSPEVLLGAWTSDASAGCQRRRGSAYEGPFPIPPHSIVQRAQIVLACGAGESNTAIAKRMGLTGMAVGKWCKRSKELGLEGLHDELRLGRPCTYEDDKVAEVINRALQTKPEDSSSGAIARVRQRLSEALEQPMQEALAFARVQPVAAGVPSSGVIPPAAGVARGGQARFPGLRTTSTRRTMPKTYRAAVDLALLDGSSAGELIPELATRGLQQLIELEVAAFLRTDRNERSEERLGYRNGYRPRTLTTQLGDLALQIP